MNIDKAVTKFIVLRDKIGDIEKRHKEELLPYFEKQDKLEAKLLKHMHDTKSESIRTAGGTAYRSHRNYDKISDWDAFLNFVREHEYWHFLFKRVSGSAVSDYLENEEALPPGVSRTVNATINIRRK